MARGAALLVLWVLSIVGQVTLGQTYTVQTFAGSARAWNIAGTSANLSTLTAVGVDSPGNVYMALGTGVVVRMDPSGFLTLVATFNLPTGIAVDAGGNVYIADSGSNLIRKVSNGVITTAAGGGSDFYGDGFAATNAQLNLHTWGGLAVDGAGNLYIADSGRIRKVSNGIITTVAGGGGSIMGENVPATSVLLLTGGIAVDAAGNLYVADNCLNRIRKVSNGIITTVAGNGTLSFLACASSVPGGEGVPATSTSLATPHGVAVDAFGNVYFMEGSIGNGRARKISNGIITTVAGGGVDLPGHPTAADNIPATSAYLGYPNGIASDATGNLYLTDAYLATSAAGRLRKVTDGLITTVAGSDPATFTGDNGLATDS